MFRMLLARCLAVAPPPWSEPSWPIYLIPAVIVALAVAVIAAISRITGWAALAVRFRTYEPFAGPRWYWQSLVFRRWCGYNNCATVGASPEGLYLALMRPFMLLNHPPLFIPWREISVEYRRTLFGLLECADLRLGFDERVPVRIQGRLMTRVREAAGPGWPLYPIEQAQARLH